MLYLITFVTFGWIARQLILAHQTHTRELGRFLAATEEDESGIEKQVDRFFERLGKRFAIKRKTGSHSTTKEKEMAVKLRTAGLESAGDHGRFAIVRYGCYLSWPVIASVAWLKFTPYYATVSTLFSFGFIVLMPHLWLSRRSLNRKEEIQRELPLVVDLTNLATSAGWDTSVALEKVIDALAPEFPGHPLIKELKRARWLVGSGYTWGEALERVSRKIGDETVTRVTSALDQAMDKGGDRSAQLAGIAADAQRSYYSALDKRLAAIPVKSLVITMVLFLTYFTILLAPSAVGVINNVK